MYYRLYSILFMFHSTWCWVIYTTAQPQWIRVEFVRVLVHWFCVWNKKLGCRLKARPGVSLSRGFLGRSFTHVSAKRQATISTSSPGGSDRTYPHTLYHRYRDMAKNIVQNLTCFNKPADQSYDEYTAITRSELCRSSVNYQWISSSKKSIPLFLKRFLLFVEFFFSSNL